MLINKNKNCIQLRGNNCGYYLQFVVILTFIFSWKTTDVLLFLHKRSYTAVKIYLSG